MPTIGVTGAILLVVLGLLLFGPKKLPELGRAVGTTIRELKAGASKMMTEPDETRNKE
nr:twin-arginine translocase TatA/TatE family subunit [Paenibacillus sp. DMB20]